MNLLKKEIVFCLTIISIVSGCARPGPNVNENVDDRYFFDRRKTAIYFTRTPSTDCFVVPLHGEIIGCKALEDADPSTFRILGDGYSLDRNNVYYEEGKLPGADPRSFKIIDIGYSSDRNSVYYKKNKIPNSDPRSFRKLNSGYSLDRNAVYFDGDILRGENPDNFQTLDYHYAKGEKNIYWSGKIVPVEDIQSFDLLNLYDDVFHGLDKYAVYCEDKKLPLTTKNLSMIESISLYHNGVSMYNMKSCSKVDVDVSSLLLFKNKHGIRYAKDRYNVYNHIGAYSYSIIERADTDTFRVLCEQRFLYQYNSEVDKYYDSYDKNHLYRFGDLYEGFDPESVDASNECQSSGTSVWDLSVKVVGTSR